jgi:tRNA-splicing ligase RtcB
VRIIEDIPVWGEPVDQGALAQIKRCAQTAQAAALMADHHKGYSMPIGGVVGYAEGVSPSGVGFDIACGNKAVLTDARLTDVTPSLPRIMDDISTTISFGLGRKNAEPVDHALFDDEAWQIPAVRRLRDRAAAQLGTVGGGNHYVDLFTDEEDRVWIGVHFGSRGFGHGVATHYLEAGGAHDSMDAAPLVLSTRSALGQDYIRAMRLAGRYAYAGRDWVCERVARIIGARVLAEVHNNHNFAWPEEIGGQKLWVVRKGATPAWPGQTGFVGGSMGDAAVILEGIDDAPEEAERALRSTVHGAGRIMSRTDARGKVRRGRVVREARVHRADMLSWVRGLGIELRGGDVDESPHVYRRLPQVLRHHQGTVRVLHTLRPIGVCMAAPDVKDPFKD